jgi:membrane protease YdiL (CAAX protease family)
MLSEKPWKLDRVILLFLAVLIGVSSFIMLQGAAEHLNGNQKLDQNSPVYVLLLTLTIHGSILLATTAVLWWFRLKWSDAFGFASPGRGRAILLGILLAALFLPVGLGLQAASAEIMQRLGQEGPPQQAVVALENAQSWGTRAYLIGFAVLIAPVAEEILFRGVLYAGIKQFGFPRFALWSTALVFAAIHMTAAIFLPLVALGLALAWLYDRTDNLLAPIAAHAFFNAANVALMYRLDLMKPAAACVPGYLG